jgi:hypothetical protein
LNTPLVIFIPGIRITKKYPKNQQIELKDWGELGFSGKNRRYY